MFLELALNLLLTRLHSSVGRASHRYPQIFYYFIIFYFLFLFFGGLVGGGGGGWGVGGCNWTATITFTPILYPQFTYLIYIICTSSQLNVSQLGGIWYLGNSV